MEVRFSVDVGKGRDHDLSRWETAIFAAKAWCQAGNRDSNSEGYT
jgi:hypothetical protein